MPKKRDISCNEIASDIHIIRVLAVWGGVWGRATLRHCTTLGSGHSNLLKNKQKIPKNTSISVLIDQFSCKNCPIKDGGCL